MCRKARESGGKNIRTRSQALIDEELLLDFPAELESLREPFSRTRRDCLMVYGNEKVGEEIYKSLGTFGSEEVCFLYQRAEVFQEIVGCLASFDGMQIEIK